MSHKFNVGDLVCVKHGFRVHAQSIYGLCIGINPPGFNFEKCITVFWNHGITVEFTIYLDKA